MKYKRRIRVPREIIDGFLLGDGSIPLTRGSVGLSLTWSSVSKEFLDGLADFMGFGKLVNVHIGQDIININGKGMIKIGDLSKNFHLSEFLCPCCGEGFVDDDLVKKLQKARDIYRRPMVITSGYRCEKHNEAVGGKVDSAHLNGEAADIEVQDSLQRFYLIDALLQAGFKRLGIGKNFAHVDIDIEKPTARMWVYDE